MTEALAFRMRLQLAQLASRHGIVTAYRQPIPLEPPVAGPVLLFGFASTTDTDLERQQFAPRCFGDLNGALPRLLWKHDPAQVAGVIESLRYDTAGNVVITARVDHPLAARAGAFSVSAAIEQFEIVDADTADFKAVVSRATITEISLTDRPANTRALVTARHGPPASNEFYDLMIRRVQLMMTTLDTIKTIAARRPEPPAEIQVDAVDVDVGVVTLPPPPPRRPTSFSSLVEEINRCAR